MEPIAYVPLYRTNDYTSFKSLKGNRDLSPINVNRLAKQIVTNPEFTRLSPLKVNEHMEVIDGQHRLEAYKKYGLKTGDYPPIYYFIHDGTSLKEARDLNAGSKPWAPIDYAHAYAQTGNRHYQTYLKFLDAFKHLKLKHEVVASYLAPNTIYDLDTFRRGDFKVESYDNAVLMMQRLEEVGPLCRDNGDWRNRLFALTFLQIASAAIYDHEKMVDNAALYGDAVKRVECDRWERPNTNNSLARALKRIYSKN